MKHPIWTVIFVVIIIGMFASSGNKNSSTYTPPVKSSTTTSTNETSVPTVTAGKVDVKSEKKKTEYGYTKIVGEVINNTSKPVEFVKVTATFYDASGGVIATGFTYAGDTASTQLEPGKTTPFEVSSFPDKSTPASYKLDVNWK